MPNFGIQGSSIITRSYVGEFALNVVTSFSKSWSYGNSTISILMPVFCSYSGATALRAASSLPWTAAMVSFAGFCPPVVPCWHAPIRSAAITSAGAHLILLMFASIPRCERARKARLRYHLPLRETLSPGTAAHRTLAPIDGA